ncbi:MAG: 4-hydroxybenzoate octaprenyltransferase [Alphaproteobacteria bacterium]|nr:4-hydroxybenzoate octaprenyltransferase [Alphaproteobacteria bacterium]
MASTQPFVTGDMPAAHWIDRYVPAPARPFFKLARIDRPIGTWLVLWPCWWSLAFAAPHAGLPAPGGTLPGWAPTGLASGGWPDPVLIALFGIGALVMRAAGCVWNDIQDRDLDAQVERTRSRPLAAGLISVTAAYIFMFALGLIGLAILVAFNDAAIWLGIASLVPACLYPLSKRFTQWPQFFLGLAFNWGALLGWAAATGTVSWAAVALYAGGIGWTLGYDTIYAHQDKGGDAAFGVGSAAIVLGDATRPWLVAFYGVFLVGLVVAGALAGSGWPFYVGVVIAAIHFGWQVRRVRFDDAASCLSTFRSNKWLGWIVFSSIVAGNVL